MSLTDLLASSKYRKTPTSVGVSVGIVTSNKDEEGLGRVKVNLSWRGEKMKVTGQELQSQWLETG